MTGVINIKQHLPTLFVTLFLIVLEGCGAIPPSSRPWFRSEVLPPLTGQVIDEETKKPIEGAIVVVRWEKYSGYSHWECPHIVTTATGVDGRYQSPGWDEWDQHIRTTRKPPLAYKAGYEAGKPSEQESVIYLKRSRQTPVERLKYLSRLNNTTRCAGGGESNYNRYTFARALYEEAKSLPVANAEESRKKLKGLKRSAARDFVSKDKPQTADEYEELIIKVYKEQLDE